MFNFIRGHNARVSTTVVMENYVVVNSVFERFYLVQRMFARIFQKS